MAGDIPFDRVYQFVVTINVPDDLAQATGLTESGARLELAVGLYQQRKISLGKAAELAGTGRTEFQRELHQRGVTINYGVSDLEADVLVLKETGQL